MPTDLEVARELAQKYPGRRKLIDKLKDRFDDRVGAVLWALYRDGAVDVSCDYGWWSDMVDATDAYTAEDVAQLLVEASRTDDMAGMLSRWSRRKQLGFNVYTRKMVKATVGSPEPLVHAYRQVAEPMRSAFGLELAKHGVLSPEDLPEGALALLAAAAVTEVGRQAIAHKVAEVWPVELAGPALNAAAAGAGVQLWSLDFLTFSEPMVTADQLARIALNIDYRDTVPKMLAVLDRHPEGLLGAIVASLDAGHEPADHGVLAAIGWLARDAGARGEVLDDRLGQRLLDGFGGERCSEHTAPMLLGVSLDLRESWVIERIRRSYSQDFAGLATTVTERTATAAIQVVLGAKRGDNVDDTAGDAFGAVARAFPDKVVSAYTAGGKVPHRCVFVEGLAQADGPAVVTALVVALADSLEAVRDAAVVGLQRLGPDAAGEAVLEALKSRKKGVRLAVAQVLGAWPHERVHEAAVAALAKEKVEDVAALLVPLARDPAAGPAPLTPEQRVKALRDALTSEQLATYDKVWSRVRWSRCTAEEGGAELIEACGDDALVVAYDGLFRNGGGTTPKLAVWRTVVAQAPVDAFVAELCLRMVAGWPLEGDNFDATVDAHRKAILGFYAFVGERFGDLARPGTEVLLREADASGHDQLWALWLDQGWDGADALFSDLVSVSGPGFATRGLDSLGSAACGPVIALLAAKKAADRQQAAEVLEARPVAEALPALEARLAVEKSRKVRAALARAAFAAAQVGAPAVGAEAATPDGQAILDARLAAYPGPQPKELSEPRALRWSSGAELSEGACRFVASRLGGQGRDHADLVLAAIAPHFDRAVANATWEALMGTLADDKAAKTGWVLFAASVLADDATMTDFGRDLDDEARYGSSSVAFYKVTILARHGSAAALTWLDHWSRKARSQGLKGRASEALEELAELRGIHPDEIADLATASFGFGASGCQPFPYGSRILTLRLTPTGTVAVVRDDGKLLKSLPKATASDDADEIAERKRVLSSLKRQLKQATKAAVERLEPAMVTGRRFAWATFESTWGGNPLLSMLAQGVVWSAYGTDGGRLALGHVGEDQDLVDAEAGRVPITDGMTVGVTHPMELTEAERASWRGVWSAAAAVPPFPQLDRPTPTLSSEELLLKTVERYEDARFATRRLRSVLEGRGWTRGAPQDAGAVLWFVKWFPRADVTAIVDLEPGFSIGGWDEAEHQAVPTIRFIAGRHGRDPGYHLTVVPVGQVDPIVVSEVMFDAETARG